MAIAGRSWLRGEVTLAEVRELIEAFPAAAELFADDAMDGSEYDVVVCDGPLVIDGDLDTLEHELCGLIVNGDLAIRGVFTDYDDPATGVYVLGTMKAGGVITTGDLGVTGSLEVDGAVVGNYNDYGATILGDVRAACLIPENHHFEVGGRVHAPVGGRHARNRISEDARETLTVIEPSRYRDVFVAEVLGSEDPPELDQEAVRERVRQRLPVVR